MLQRLWNRWRRGRRLILVLEECPFLAEPEAVPVTELPPEPMPKAGRRWPRPTGSAVLGLCYGTIVSLLAFVVIITRNLRRTAGDSPQI